MAVVTQRDINELWRAIALLEGNIANRRGYVIARTGTATIVSGSTSIAVTHNLPGAPSHVFVTPRENPTNAVAYWWWDTPTSTQFTINVNANPGASNLDCDWIALIKAGN